MEKFNYETNGYNKEEVNKFIEEVINNTEDIVQKYLKQKNELEMLKKQLNHYKNIEEKIEIITTKAQMKADNIKEMAEKERDIIIKEAKENASIIINDSLKKTEILESKREIIQDNFRNFREKMKVIIGQEELIIEELNNIVINNE